ncbi:MAG: enoyl-CoA hydratase/isomerase family protein, partial [Terriglobales bacterium]
CFEFHSKMNTIGGDAVALITSTLAERDTEFDAYIVSNGAENFSVGADLLYLLALIQSEEWDEVAEAVRRFQEMNQAIKRSPRPVVVAPFGLTLGGGCEMLLHGARAVAHAELYAGLVEVGVGLIPAGGGTTQMALRCDPRSAFEAIALARVSTSAAEARQQHFLRRGDLVVANRDRVLGAAKREALQLASSGYAPPTPQRLRAPGPSVASTLQLGAYLMREADRISDHDLKIAEKLIHVVCGGGAPQGAEIGEEEMLDLEREAFLSLCGEIKTQERIGTMLQTGKALRN